MGLTRILGEGSKGIRIDGEQFRHHEFALFNTEQPDDTSVGFPSGSDGKESACNAGDLGSIPGLGRFPGGEGMTTHPGILACEIPLTGERGGLHSTLMVQLDMIGHDRHICKLKAL